MKLREYLEHSSVTSSHGDEEYENAIKENFGHNTDLVHAAIGLVTEAAEVLDQVKKVLFYSKDVDYTNLIEELGDVEWYRAMLIRYIEEDMKTRLTDEYIRELNIAKLKARYGGKFSTDKALNRDLVAERKILEDDI